MARIAMPVRTVAEWGGVHEWVVDAARALRASGHEVTILGAGETFQRHSQEAGAEFIPVDWSDIAAAASDVQEVLVGTDLLFAHAPQGRMLALELGERLSVPVHVMVHGAYHDFMYEWGGRVESFMAASPSLMYFVQHVGRIEPWKCSLVANGVSDEVFDMPVVPLEEKLGSGTARIVTASRLAADKTNQIGAVKETLRACIAAYPDVKWVLDVYGDGPLRERFESAYRKTCAELGTGTVQMHGWIEPSQVPVVLNRSVVSVMAGMGGVRGVAAGSLVVGAGARGVVGVQADRNLRAGIFSNFGDHGCPRFEPTPISLDLSRLLQQGRYEETLRVNRELLRRGNSQSSVDSQMLAALQLL